MKKFAPSLIAAVLTACLVSFAAACPKNPPEVKNGKDTTAVAAGNTLPFAGPPQKVRDEDRGLSLLAPGDWKVKRSQHNPILFLSAPGAGPNGPLANVVVEDITQRMNPADYLQANLLTMQVSLPGLENITARNEYSAGIPMAWIQFTFLKDEVKVRALAYCQTKDFQAYVVTMVAPEADFARHEPTFRYIGRSLRVE
jgi:hypothetical protein